MEWHPPGLSVYVCLLSEEAFFWHQLTQVVPEKGHKTAVVRYLFQCFDTLAWQQEGVHLASKNACQLYPKAVFQASQPSLELFQKRNWVNRKQR